MEVIIILGIILFIAFAMASANNKKKKVAARTATLNQKINEAEGFKPSVSVTGVDSLYRFSVDNDSRQVLVIKNGIKTFIPFEKIISVAIEEDNTQIMSKSSIRTVGGVLVGGALAGSAGAIVGGLSGAQKVKKKVSRVKVVMKLRDLKEPSFEIDCFNAKTMIGSDEIKASGTFSDIYNKGVADAQRIADLVGVIIDQVDQEQKTDLAAPNHSAASTDKISDLERLAALKERGILTQEEFEQQKKAILNS